MLTNIRSTNCSVKIKKKKYFLDFRFVNFEKEMIRTNSVLNVRPRGGKSPSNWIAYRLIVKDAINNDLIDRNMKQSNLSKKKKKIFKK